MKTANNQDVQQFEIELEMMMQKDNLDFMRKSIKAEDKNTKTNKVMHRKNKKEQKRFGKQLQYLKGKIGKVQGQLLTKSELVISSDSSDSEISDDLLKLESSDDSILNKVDDFDHFTTLKEEEVNKRSELGLPSLFNSVKGEISKNLSENL